MFRNNQETTLLQPEGVPTAIAVHNVKGMCKESSYAMDIRLTKPLTERDLDTFKSFSEDYVGWPDEIEHNGTTLTLYFNSKINDGHFSEIMSFLVSTGTFTKENSIKYLQDFKLEIQKNEPSVSI